jgi:hypothetical protein
MSEPLIGIGFWRSLYEPALPAPAWFVDEHWDTTEKQRVLAYLKQGRRINHWMGYSWCRFRCGANPATMGAGDLTDGTYCWHEGLMHYLEQHQLRLPPKWCSMCWGNRNSRMPKLRSLLSPAALIPAGGCLRPAGTRPPAASWGQ